MSNRALVALARPLALALAVSVYLPTSLILRSANVATPLAAGTVVVPPSVVPVGFVPSAIVTSPVKLATTFSRVSNAVTCTGGEMTLPAMVLCGCVVNSSRAAAAGVMSNVGLVAPRAPGAVATSV